MFIILLQDFKYQMGLTLVAIIALAPGLFQSIDVSHDIFSYRSGAYHDY